MLKIALTFVLVGMLPLFLSTMRFKTSENDTPEQKVIKENMRKTQLIIAAVFFSAAAVLSILSFFAIDKAVADIIILCIYSVVVFGTVAYAIIRQIALQKAVRQMMKK